MSCEADPDWPDVLIRNDEKLMRPTNVVSDHPIFIVMIRAIAPRIVILPGADVQNKQKSAAPSSDSTRRDISGYA